MDRIGRRQFMRRSMALASAGLLAGCSRLAVPAAPKAMHRIVFVGGPLAAERLEAFKDGLRELGHIEGRHYTWEFHDHQGRAERVPELAASRPSMALAASPDVVRAFRAADRNLPIIMVGASEIPVELGLIDSFARPGGTVTGLAAGYPQLATKRLELLKEVVTDLARVAVLGDANGGPWEDNPKYPLFRAAASDLKLDLRVVNLKTPEEFAGAFAEMAAAGVQGYYAEPGGLVYVHRARLAELAVQHRLPGIYGTSLYADAAPLVYGANVKDIWRRTSIFVDKIIRGARPADIPVEAPTTFDFVINRSLAEAVGLSIEPSVLQRATVVIE